MGFDGFAGVGFGVLAVQARAFGVFNLKDLWPLCSPCFTVPRRTCTELVAVKY